MSSIYSPGQIIAATFIGGPLAAAYFLKKSFESINKNDLAKKTFYGYLILSAIIIVISPFLPDETPNMLIPIAYLIPVVMILKEHYLTKTQISDSEEYEFESNWKVFGISLAAIVFYMGIFVGVTWVTMPEEDVAQYFVEDVNATNFELNPYYYSSLEAKKGLNDSDVILTITLTSTAVDELKGADKGEFRRMAMDFIADNYLLYLAENNVRVTVDFQNLAHETVKKITL
ncbi:hypothetical protein I6F48_16050 [Pseudoalteromonas sp. SWYJ118]|uniref:hypothetical protein n=1 Tax=Pseudoalteromonas sp. SWYJ118 TaxID=2792062 RepID=UPI0018CCD6A1|nr:hypothetical protein [Pseudoalteromonas sp. SWYJ118]MBH0077039.1 hypothetical protein [Pseudoalteromonas sp. SWYJ118]